jgi:orotate phosphoribosyltransferase
MAGHTAFRNGDHSDGWIEKGSLFRHPSRMTPIAQLQAAQIQAAFPETELIVGASQCGAIIAATVAALLGCDLALTVASGTELSFHRMHIPAQGQRTVLVDDLICSGTDVRAHVAFFQECGLALLGVSAWINRQPEQIAGVQVLSLLAPPFQTYPAHACPLCQAGLPIVYTHVRE